MTITSQQVDAWDAEVDAAYASGVAAGAAAEREACAELLEKQKYMVLEPLRTYTADALARSNRESVMYMAKAIRARGNT